MKDRILLQALFFLVLIYLFPGGAHGQAAAQVSRVTLPLNESARVVLNGGVHPLARPQFDSGIAATNLPMEDVLLLLRRSPQQETALQDLLKSQQTKSSPNFHKWLTPQEFGARFGASDADIKAVSDWLVSHGFSVQPVSAGRTLLRFSGSAGSVQNAFHTEIHKYTVGGREYLANDRPVQIPAALAPVIDRLVSLNNFAKPIATQKIQNLLMSRPTKDHPKPEVTLTGCNSTASCYGVGPADFANIYDVNPLYTAAPAINGTGVTIAIASSSNINIRDTQNFRALFNLPANDPQITVVGPDPGLVPGEEGLANLQVQWAGAVAPGATINLVVTQTNAPSTLQGVATDGSILSAIYVLDNNLAPILTLSYTDCEPATGADGSGNTFYHYIWEQAAAEGITVIAPAGDTGAAGCDNHFTEIAASQGIAVNAVASTVFNVAVGGTDFNDVGNWSQYWNSSNDPTTSASALGYIPEETWNDSCAENGPNGCGNPNPSGSDLVAGGGGCSSYSATPAWQASLGLCTGTGGTRALPDVSLFSGDGNNGSFYLVCQGDANSNGDPSCNLNSPYLNIQGLGGTTASAAAFAGVMALVDQYNKGPQGNANFVLYPLAANSAANAFHDITQGDTSVACVAASFLDCSNQGTGYGIIADASGAIWSAAPGYDYATGLGSLDVNNLVTKWSSVNFTPTTTTIAGTNPASLTSPNLTHGQPVAFTINVAPTGGSGTPTGDVALMVNPNPAPAPPFGADVFTLVNGAVTPSGTPTHGGVGVTTNLPGGTYQLYAHYAGDGTFAPSDSAPISVTVGAQQSQTTIQVEDYSSGPLACLDSGGASESYGSIYFLRVVIGNPQDSQVQPSNCYSYITRSNSPTGTVTLSMEAQNPSTFNPQPPVLPLGTYTLNGRGFVEIPSPQIPRGTYYLSATYSGDTSYGPSSAACSNLSSSPFFFPNCVGNPTPAQPFYSIQITQGTALLTLSASSTLVGVGQPVTVTATALNSVRGSTVSPPTGTVSFTASNGSSATGTLGPNPVQLSFPNNVSQFTITPTQLGTITVNAQYSGDPNYTPVAAQAPVVITVGSPDFKVASSPANIAITAGQSATSSIVVTPLLGFSGAISLSCPSSLPPGMTCAISPSTVTHAGNGSPITATLTLTSQGPSVLLADARPQQDPQQHRRDFGLMFASLAFAAALFVGGKRRGKAALLTSAAALIFFCGSCSNVSVTPSRNSALTLTSSSIKSPATASVNLIGAVSADHTVTGTVDFFDNGTQIAQGVTLQVGRATFPTNSLVLGTHPITATYSGDPKTDSAQVQTPLSQVITGSSQLQVTAASGSLTHNLQVQFSLN
jgi:hypothetical protein